MMQFFVISEIRRQCPPVSVGAVRVVLVKLPEGLLFLTFYACAKLWQAEAITFSLCADVPISGTNIGSSLRTNKLLIGFP